MNYQLQIKQIVDYPRNRIYREFIRDLMNDTSIRTTGNSLLFYYIILYSFVNYRSSYQRYDGISYLIGPGEWICRTKELSTWFRTRFQYQAIDILDQLALGNYITYTELSRGNLIKFHITDWKKSNISFDYNCPCTKDAGFFFFPMALVSELISIGKCSEMDCLLDLWLHAIYQDEQIQGSDLGPIVYFRDGSSNPVTSCSQLSQRWGISKATVCRFLKKMEAKDYLELIPFSGSHGSVIYLHNYLSTMFHISDVMINKEEIAMSFNIPVSISDSITSPPEISDEQISVSPCDNSVSKNDIKQILQKVAGILETQGLSCCSCSRTHYKLYRLSACQEPEYRYLLQICCSENTVVSHFELTLTPCNANCILKPENIHSNNA